MITSLEIQRSKWLTPDNNPEVYGSLCNIQGLMCCLGFCMIKEGKTKDEIIGKGLPHCIEKENTIYTIINGTEIRASDFAINAANINDEINIRNETRESKLITLFAQNGIELTFKD